MRLRACDWPGFVSGPRPSRPGQPGLRGLAGRGPHTALPTGRAARGVTGAWPDLGSGSRNFLQQPFAVAVGVLTRESDLLAERLCDVGALLHDQVDCPGAACGQPEARLFHHLPAMAVQPMRRGERETPDPAMISRESGHDTCDQLGPDMADQQGARPVHEGPVDMLRRPWRGGIQRAALPEPDQAGPVRWADVSDIEGHDPTGLGDSPGFGQPRAGRAAAFARARRTPQGLPVRRRGADDRSARTRRVRKATGLKAS